MLLLEDEHGPESDGTGTRAANVDTGTLGLHENLVPARRVPRNECPLSLAAKILDLVRELLRQLFEAVVEVVAGLDCVLHKVETLNLVDDGAEEDGTSGVTYIAKSASQLRQADRYQLTYPSRC